MKGVCGGAEAQDGLDNQYSSETVDGSLMGFLICWVNNLVAYNNLKMSNVKIIFLRILFTKHYFVS